MDSIQVQIQELESRLRQAQALAVQKQFEVTKLSNAGFFRRHWGNLRKNRMPPGQNTVRPSWKRTS